MFVKNNSLLFVAILVVACVIFSSSASSSTVDALSVTFNNGSILVLNNTYFTGTFPQMQQDGLAPGQHDWEMSLVDPSTFNGNCPSAQYIAETRICDEVKFGTAAYSATPNSDGSGVQLTFKATNYGNQWQASFNIVCDPTQNTLFSPTNSYTASQPSTDIVVAWTLKSRGACVSPPTPPPPPPSGPTVTFDNGSVLVLNNTYFENIFPQMQQTGLAPGHFVWSLSLATPDTFNHLCSTPVYLGQGSKCDQITFKNAPAATPNYDGSGVKLIYREFDPLGRKWQVVAYVNCDPRRDKLYSPSNSYDAAQPADTIILSFFLTSKGACLSSNPPTPPPSPSPSFNRRVTFANGSSVLLNKFFFTANFPQMVEEGLAPGKNDIHMSLVSPSTFDNTCRNASYISMNKCTGALFDTAPLYVVPNSAQSGVEFVFQGTSQSGFGFQANINVVCDLSRNELTSPSNSYQAGAPASKIILTWEMASRGACVNQN